jgi:hypothetical protein
MRKGKRIKASDSGSDGRATFQLTPGDVCAAADETPAGPVNPVCGTLVAGGTLEIDIDVSDCPPLHCSGREP